jgi:purine-binding chemotaxis protein CheW
MLGREEYGIEILKVHQIIQMQEVTRVPKTPEYVRGVINLRGRVIPVIDLRLKFGMQSQEDTEKTCIIVAQIDMEGHSITMGTIIDEVREVLEITAEDIEETPSFGDSVDTQFIMGMAKLGERVKMLLDMDKVLSAHELHSLSQLAK